VAVALRIGLDDIDGFVRAHGVSDWGVASNDPPMDLAPSLPRAISLMVGYRASALADMVTEPTVAYFTDYRRLNDTLNAAAAALCEHLLQHGCRAEHVDATLEDYEQVADWGQAGVFAHKTAATRAGLGWIGKTALFVSPVWGPKIRLATVFTDLELPAGVPVDTGRCGRCTVCVDACPAHAGRDVRWIAGMARDELYDEKACEAYTDRFPELGGVCGICVAVCPFGRRALAHLMGG
jgi:epoxyqueuosine reductase